MDSEKKSLKLFFVLFLLILFLGILGSFFLRQYSEEKNSEGFVDDVELVESSYDRDFPQIINEPSRSVFVDELFVFQARVSPMDDFVFLDLLEAPDWLVFEEGLVKGVPEEVGTASFILRVEKDGRYVDNEFFLVVKPVDNE